MKISYHVKEERIDRLAFILTETGLGEIKYRNYHKPGRVRCATTTGVIMILNREETTLITAYYGNATQLKETCGGDLPLWLHNVLRNNIKKGYTKMG